MLQRSPQNMLHVLLGTFSDKPHAPNNDAMKGASMVHWSYPIHAYFFTLTIKSRMMGMLLKNWRLWQGELCTEEFIHLILYVIMLYQNSQNEVVYEQVQDTQHDTTDLKV